MGDTIAAIATPPGQGGLAVIRVSGPAAQAIVVPLLEASRPPLAEPRRVYHARFVDRATGQVIDEVLTFRMAAPRSYTGEDVVEVQCHGGSVVARRVLDGILAAGARPADPGEFTKRAFLNGRLDLAQAEAVADLIAARSDTACRLAWSQLEGALSSRVHALREAVIAARGHCEAALDFPDEDVPELSGGDVARELTRVRHELAQLVAGYERARVRYEGVRVALVGKPNVGKSSLLNALAGRERAIVTPVAGTTRDVVEATVALDDLPVVLADTAGLRDTDDPIEVLGVARTRAAIADAACTLAVFDRADALDGDDDCVAAAVVGRPTLAVLNKCDLPARTTAAEVRARLGEVRVVEVSASEGSGLGTLTAGLAAVLFAGRDAGEDEVAIFRARHHDAARRAAGDLARGEAALAGGAPLELVASDLAAAASALGAITGEITSEEVLDRVFAEFCIGK